MNSSGFFTLAAMMIGVVALIYQMAPLRRTKIWYLSLQQILLLVVVPGLIFPMLFSYLQTMVRLPRNEGIFLPDGFLVSEILLSILFAYGGISIHAVTKMLSEFLAHTNTEAERVNRFFHTTFSHNLAFMGIILASLGLTLLELNHVSSDNYYSIRGGVIRGLLLGGSFALATYNYTRYTGGDFGKWSDLKLSFAGLWAAFAFLLYFVQKLDPRFTDYQLLLPMFLSFSLMVLLSLILVFRRIKRGGWRIWVGRRKLRQYLSIEEHA